MAKTKKNEFRLLIHMLGRGKHKFWEIAFNKIGLILYSITNDHSHFSKGQSLLIIIIASQAETLL
jgi:hypothetical protein